MTLLTWRRAQARTASRTPAPGMARMAQSTARGRSSTEATQGRPLISARFGLIRWISPGKPARSRLLKTPFPNDLALADAPMIAIDCGRSKLSRAGRFAGAVAGKDIG